MDDRELLRRYAMGDGEAFAELVRRHRDWVYSVCLRRLGDTGLAEDAAQVVFLALAREAARVAKHPRVLGWLHRASRYTAVKIRRDEARREKREREVAAMGASVETEADWEAMRGVIEEAMDHLGARDREAVLLRFYRQLPHAEVGRAMGISEEAAKKRVNRALERLRGMVGARGERATGAGIGAAMAAHGIVRPSTALGAGLERVARGEADGHVRALAKGVSQMMGRAKAATMVGWTAAVMVAVAAATVPLVKGAHSAARPGPPAADTEVPGLQQAWHYGAETDAPRGLRRI